MSSDKKKKKIIIQKLIKKGLLKNERIKNDLPLSLNEYFSTLADNEINLLKEITRIDVKKKNQEKLSYIEDSFFNFFLKKYG